MIRVIINSDDFGFDQTVNSSIIKAFNSGLISSTTTLVNYPDGLLDGYSKLCNSNINFNSVGIHLNLTTGKPLTKSISNNPNFCMNRTFHSRVRDKPRFYFNKKSRADIEAELEAQILRFIDVMGSKPSHIDGHHHIHTEYAIFKIIAKLAKKYKIHHIRKTRNLGIKGISLTKKLYKYFLNYIINKNFSSTKYFGSLNDLEGHEFDYSQTYEIMVHAVYENEFSNRVLDDDGLILKDKIRKYLPDKFLLCRYGDLG